MKKIAILLAGVVIVTAAALCVSIRPDLPNGAVWQEYYIAGSVADQAGWQTTRTTNMTILRSYDCGLEFDAAGSRILGYAKCYDLGTIDVNRILTQTGAKIVHNGKEGDILNYYCYSSAIGGGVTVDGMEINLQIACTDYGIVVGCPLIIGSY